jgi:hypothetical protein
MEAAGLGTCLMSPIRLIDAKMPLLASII